MGLLYKLGLVYKMGLLYTGAALYWDCLLLPFTGATFTGTATYYHLVKRVEMARARSAEGGGPA